VSIRRAATIGSALIVAAIAAYASYSHMRHLALAYGQDRAVATMLPISVDGMMVVATVALGDGRRQRWSAWLAFWTGVAASVVANVLAAEPSAIARCISAWPAVAFLLVVEVITRGARIRSAGRDALVDSAARRSCPKCPRAAAPKARRRRHPATEEHQASRRPPHRPPSPGRSARPPPIVSPRPPGVPPRRPRPACCPARAVRADRSAVHALPR
jgi:hypothetical protein